MTALGKPFEPVKLRRRVFSQLWMLALQFLLGMTMNVIGFAPTGALRTFYIVVLVTHILNAIGLLEGGIYINLKAPSQLAWWSTIAIAITFTGGILTELTKSDGWSLVMAVGFLASSWLTGALYVQADRAVHKAS